MTAVKLLPLLEGVHWSREKDFQAYANVEARPSVRQAPHDREIEAPLREQGGNNETVLDG